MGVYPVRSILTSDAGLALEVSVTEKALSELERGASISVDGVCLSVVDFEVKYHLSAYVKFDVVPETLRSTNLGELTPSSLVNMERSIKFGDEIGGHLCSGHIDG